jgi:diguanylate cyclase (GGDEF)-like protein
MAVRPGPGRRGLLPSLGEDMWQEAGAEGERVLARVRLLVLLVFLALLLLPAQDAAVRQVALPPVLIGLVLGAAVYHLAGRRPRRWLAFAGSAADVVLVTVALATFVAVGAPHAALNGAALYEVYFLAIALAALRYDWRVCALTGGLALVLYGALLGYAAWRWDLNDVRFAPFRYGMFEWSSQAARLGLLAVATLVSAAVVRRARRLPPQVALDRLTGLPGRAAFEVRAAEEMSRAGRYARPLAVALAEVDGLAALRQEHGPAGMEAALQAVAGVLLASVRRSDLAAHLGDGRFGLLLPETTAEIVRSKLEDVRYRVAEARVLVGRRRAHRLAVTVSIGVANWPDDGAGLPAVLERAAARLGEAASAGGHRLVGPDGGPRAAGSPDAA